MNHLTKCFTIVLAVCMLSQLSLAQTYITDDLGRAAGALSQKAATIKNQNSPATSDLKYYQKYASATKKELKIFYEALSKSVNQPYPEAIKKALDEIEKQIGRLEQVESSDSKQKPTTQQLSQDEALPSQIGDWYVLKRKYERLNRSQMSQFDFNKGRITFQKHPEHAYDFDAYQPTSNGANYPNLGDDYRVSYLLVPVGKATKILATIDKGSVKNPDEIRFLDGQGTTLSANFDATTKSWTIDFPASDKVGTQEVYARCQDDTESASVGKMLVKRYKEESKN